MVIVLLIKVCQKGEEVVNKKGNDPSAGRRGPGGGWGTRATCGRPKEPLKTREDGGRDAST